MYRQKYNSHSYIFNVHVLTAHYISLHCFLINAHVCVRTHCPLHISTLFSHECMCVYCYYLVYTSPCPFVCMLTSKWDINDVFPQVDEDIRRLLESILYHYIYSWYSWLSQDDAFVDSVRDALGVVLTRFVCRLSEV